MRILQIISHYVPSYRFGGPLHVAHQLGKALMARGHEVRVCATNLLDRQQDLSVPVDQIVDVEGVNVFYEPVVCFRKWGYSPRMTGRLNQEIPQADIILIHAHFQFAHWIGAKLARRHDRPYVIFAHSSLRKAAIRSSSYWSKQIYLRLMEWRNLQGARFVAFNAEEEMEDSLFRGRGVIIPNGIDPESFEPLPRRGAFRERHPELSDKICFLFLGRIDIAQKAVDKIIDGYSLVAKHRPEVHLILAGPSEGEDADKISALVRQHKLAGRVTMTGLVTGSEKVAMLRDCDVFLLPSNFEGLSIALLEAMYCGLPVIVSKYAGLSREVRKNDCGIVVEPRAEDIAQAMREMLNRETRIRAGRNSRELMIREYVWDKIAGRLLTTIQ